MYVYDHSCCLLSSHAVSSSLLDTGKHVLAFWQFKVQMLSYQAANASGPAVVPTVAPAVLGFTGTVLGLPTAVGSVDASHLPPQLGTAPSGFSIPPLPNTTYYALAAGTGLGSLQLQLSYVQVTGQQFVLQDTHDHARCQQRNTTAYIKCTRKPKRPSYGPM